ncbi:MAG: hypothetical protein LWX83_02805 [Anaerolineae bacterium]|nr:hypothetical protein [Anaerolineae bacterium]
MIRANIKYTLLSFRLDQIWLPAGLMFLFMILTVIMRDTAYDVARAFLGFVLPLIAGIMGAYLFLEDPTLELQFSMPRPVNKRFAEKLGLIMVITTCFALAFQVFLALTGINLAPLGDLLFRQWSWFFPSLVMLLLGLFSSLAFSNPAGGALATGFIWLFEIIAHGWFTANSIARYFFLFLGSVSPFAADRLGNFAVLTLVGLACLGAACRLFGNSERYL